MSNFIKQRYVINLENEKVVINSDDKYIANSSGQQMASLSFPAVGLAPESEENLDGFLAGLNAEEVYVEPQPDPEEILEEARMEAERILSEATARVAQMENEASHHAELVYEQKRQDGYNFGMSQSQAEIDAHKAKLQSEYDALSQNLQMDYEAKLDTLEQDIVDVMIRVFNKVFHIQFDNKRQILLHLIKDTLLGIDAGKNFHIRVAEANFKYIESHIAEIKEKIGNDVNIDVINDISMNEDGCIIETADGVHNCGIDTVLDNLEKDIRSLCR